MYIVMGGVEQHFMGQNSDIIWKNGKRLIKDLVPWEYNPRTINSSKLKLLKNSLKENGYFNPIVIDTDNTVVCGHQRLRTFLKIGMGDDEIDVRIPDRALTKKEFKDVAYIDNQEFGEYDLQMIVDSITEEYTLDHLIENVGFERDALEGILEQIEDKDRQDTKGDDQLIDIDKKNVITKEGDFYELGMHRLICGDSTDAMVVDQLTGDLSPVLMVTDPPYGVNYEHEWRKDVGLNDSDGMMGKVENDDRCDWKEAYKLFSGKVVYVWHSAKNTHEFARGLIESGFELISQIIWTKQSFVFSRGDYHWRHEPCWYANKKGQDHNWKGDRKQSTVWEIKNSNNFGKEKTEGEWGHGTQKPLECMARPIQNNSIKGDIIYDPFGGSGTTLIACEKLNRKCTMVELMPIYCDAIVKRYVWFCKKKQ